MSTTIQSDMVASYKAIEFTADHTKWAREKSTFLARCGKDGTDEILKNTYQPYVQPRNFGTLTPNIQYEILSKIREDQKKLRALQKTAWAHVHEAGFLNFTSIINTHEESPLESKARDAWLAIVAKMEGSDADADTRKALHFDNFATIKMVDTPGRNPALDFDEFISALEVAQRNATAAGVTIDPAQVFSQLRRGIPNRYRNFQLNATISGHKTYAAFRTAIRDALDQEFLLKGRTAAEQVDLHAKNEKSTVQSLAAVLTKAGDKSPEEIAALVVQHRQQSKQGGGGKSNKRQRKEKQPQSQGSQDKSADSKQVNQLKQQIQKLKQQLREQRSSSSGGGRSYDDEDSRSKRDDKRDDRGNDKQGGRDARQDPCTDCGKKGHKRGDRRCTALRKGYPHQTNKDRGTKRSLFAEADDDDTWPDSEGEHSMMICAGRSNVRRLLCAVAASGIAKYFVVDSGASTTTCKNKEAFITLVPDRTPITQADGTVTYTEGRGSIDFGEFGILPNCLYAPAFEYNLLSVPHLNEYGFTVAFDGKHCLATSSNGKTHRIAELLHGLYLAPMCSRPEAVSALVSRTVTFEKPSLVSRTVRFVGKPAASAAAAEMDDEVDDDEDTPDLLGSDSDSDSDSDEDADATTHHCAPAIQVSPGQLIHQRCAHVSDTYLYTAVREGLVVGLRLPPRPSRFVYPFCDACALAKSTNTASTRTVGSKHNVPRKPAVKPTSDQVKMTPSDSTTELKLVRPPFTLAPLTKVAWDVKGPIRPATLGGARYLLLGTCVVSNKRFVYLLRTKDETAEYVLKAALEIKGHGGTLKIVKSDNGGEFVSDQFRNALLSNNITYETTSPHTPHQNGKAERSNRSQCELAVACMHAANAEPHLWGWAVTTVVFITDRMPTRATDMRTSAYFEIHGQPADLSRLRVWGCDAFIHLPRNKQPSFGPRAVKGTFVGYDPHSLAYIVKVNKTFYRSGHVKFNEDLSSRQPLTAAQDQAYQQLLDDMDQDAVVAPVTRSTVPPIVRVEPLEYDDSDDFPDDGKTVELKAPGQLIENVVLFREAATQASPAPDEDSEASASSDEDDSVDPDPAVRTVTVSSKKTSQTPHDLKQAAVPPASSSATPLSSSQQIPVWTCQD